MKVPKDIPDAFEILNEISKSDPKKMISLFIQFGPVDHKNRYLHWEEIKFKRPPKGFTREEWWAGTKAARMRMAKEIDLYDKKKHPFVFALTDDIFRDLHWLDQQTAGNLSAPEDSSSAYDSVLQNADLKKKYILKSLVTESIYSSILEGATTTRSEAQKMLAQGRKPITESEQMIVNNYHAMQFIKTVQGQELTPELIFELHRIITEKTLKNTAKAGVLRDKNDNVDVVNMYNEVLHDPPDAKELPKRIQKICDFANDDNDKIFLHPVIKAIILHFMIGYDHPFVDGNGRTARALFYWYMIHKGYWLIEFISISEMIKIAPAKYGRAYLYTETDGNDLTYFLIHQINIIKKAIQKLLVYLSQKIQEDSKILKQFPILAHRLNTRQIELLKNALKYPGKMYSIKEYRNQNSVAYDTARNDLLDLSDNYQLLDKRKIKKTFKFAAPKDLKARMKKIVPI